MTRTPYTGLMCIAYDAPDLRCPAHIKYAGLRTIAGLAKQAQAEQTPYLVPTYQHALDRLTKNWSPGAQAVGQLGGGLAPYFIPVARTVVPAQSALANAANVFTPGLSMKQRAAYGGTAVIDGALAALGLLSDVGTGAAALATAPAAGAGGAVVGGATSGLTGGLAAAIRNAKWFTRLQAARNAIPGGKAATKYLQGGHKWQQGYANWAKATKFTNPVMKRVHTYPKQMLHFMTGHPIGQLSLASSGVTALMPDHPQGGQPAISPHAARSTAGGMAAYPTQARQYAQQMTPRERYFHNLDPANRAARWGAQYA